MGDKKICVEEVRLERARIDGEIAKLQQQREELGRMCSHKYKDGKDATEGVPVSGERFCRTCGAQYD